MDIHNMNLRDLEYLVAVADLKHFRKAAERCFVSQPTLSAQLKKLEEYLGVQLFERSQRKVSLTHAGTVVLEHARQVLLEVKAIKEKSQQLSDPLEGPMHIGLIPTVAPYLLPLIVAPLKKAFPQMSLFLHEGQTHRLVQQLADGEIDAAILALPVPQDTFSYFPLYSEDFSLAVYKQHPLAKLKQVKPEHLSGYEISLLAEGHCLRDQALDVCHSGGATDIGSFSATSLETLRYMVEAQEAITLIPQLAVTINGSGKRYQNLKYLGFSKPKPCRQIALVYRKRTARFDGFKQIADLMAEKVERSGKLTGA